LELTREDIVEIHDRVIVLYGGIKGILNEGTIEYAIASASKKQDVVDQAAVILEIVAKRHPFLDGNKRTAFASAAVLLRLDGYETIATDDEIISFMLDSAAGRLTRSQVVTWLKDRLKRVVRP
jgi:death on curing protein